MSDADLKVQLSADPGNMLTILAQVSRSLDGLVRDLHNVAKASEAGFGAATQKAEAMRAAVQNSAKSVDAYLGAMQSKAKALNDGGLGLSNVATKGFSAPVGQATKSLDELLTGIAKVDPFARAAAGGLGLASGSASSLSQSLQQGTSYLHQHRDALQGGTRQVQEIRAAHESWTPSILKAGLALEAIRAVLFGMREVGQQVLNSNLELERSQRALALATGDGAASMAFIRRISAELGLDLTTAAQGFGMMANAARGTRMEGEGAKSVFIAVSRAVSAMGLDAQQTHGVLLALSQMLSKGKVMAEEMRKQLGEHLPGAFQIAARAMGVTTAELDKMLRDGKVIADDFLPKFARQMEKELGDAPDKAAQSLQANLNRIKSAFQIFSYEMGQAGASAGLSEALARMNTALNSAEGIAGARALGRALGDLAQGLATVATNAWQMRQPLLAIAAAWGALQVSRLLQSLVAWATAKAALVAETRAAAAASLQEAIVLAGGTAVKTADTRAEVTRTLALLASREAAIQNAVSLGAMTLADKEAELQALATARAKLVEAAAANSAGAAVTGSASALAGGPWGIITMALMAIASAWVMVGDSAKEARQKLEDAARDADTGAAKFRDLSEEALRLNKILKDGSATTEEKTQAQSRLKLVLEQIRLIYPELNVLLKEEGGYYTNVAESIRAVTLAKIQESEANNRLAKSAIAATKAALVQMEAEVARLKLLDRQSPEAGGSLWKRDMLVLEAQQKANEIRKNIEIISKGYDLSLATEKKYRDQLAALDAKPRTASKPTGDASEDMITEEEHAARLLRLEQQILQAKAWQSLEDERRARLADAETDYKERMFRLDNEWSTSKIDDRMYQEQATKLEEWKAARVVEINREMDQKVQNFNIDRERAHEDLMNALEVQEEESLNKRLAKIEKQFADIRRKNVDEAAKGGSLVPDVVIDQAEFAAKMQAWRDSVKQEVSKLKQELGEQAQIKGSALNLEEINRVLERFSQKSAEAAAAARVLRQELRVDQGAKEGMISALDTYITTSQNQFQVWKNVTSQILQGLENSFAQFFENIFKHGMTGAQKWDALWKGIASSVLKALAQMAAQWLVAAAAEAIFGKTIALSKVGQTTSALTLASAETWAAYAGIPFVGPALAMAQIELMFADMAANVLQGKTIGASAAVYASGGIIDGPTLALMGEAGRELVVPETTFTQWAENLVANLTASQGRVDSYRSQASAYTSAASREAAGRMAAGDPAFAGARFDLRGAHIFTNNNVEMARFLRGLSNNFDGLTG